MNIYEAIFNRRSVRKYVMEPLDAEILEKIRKMIENTSSLDGASRVEFDIYENLNKKNQVKGLLKSEAPYYLIVYCEDTPSAYRSAGYIAEQAVLYMTTKEIGTCYLGSAKVGPKEKNGLKQFLVIAFGRAEGTLYRDMEEAHRLPLSSLCTYKDEPGEYLKKILKAARMAPSSMNTQPWRFIVYADRLYVFAKKEALPQPKMFTTMRQFDMGIMLCHIMLAAEEFWMNIETVTEEQYAKKNYKNGEYICTIIFHS
ncbi:MAG: nitroreductase family protein [Lachnospiraceae bacterium]|nr:nitroreductase family protein [Lachnospiraceae bacterium]